MIENIGIILMIYGIWGEWDMSMKKLYLCLALILVMLFGWTSFAEAARVALMLEGSDASSNASGFNGLCLEGLNEAASRYGNKISAKYYNAREDKASMLPLLREAAENSDLIIIASSRYLDALKEVSKEFPDRTYVVFDNAGNSGATEVVFREEEGGFLAGVLAALMTTKVDQERIDEDKVIGILLGEKVPPSERFRRGYVAGSWYVDPEIKVLCEYTDDFSDRRKAETLAAKLKNSGADVIFCAAGDASFGAVEKAKEAGYWTIGVDAELEKDYPDAVLASVVKRIGMVISKIIEEYIGGWRGGSEPISLGLSDGCIDLSTWTREAKNNIPVDIRKQVDEVADKLEAGLLIIEERDFLGMKEI